YIRNAAERMGALIDGVLAYSEAARTTNESAKIADAGSVALAAMAKFRDEFEEQQVTVTIDALPSVLIEPKQLLQVFESLLSNALRERQPDQPPRISISAVEQDRGVQFAVADNGIGIDPRHRDRIFVLFRRLHGSEYPGVGAGLAVSKR